MPAPAHSHQPARAAHNPARNHHSPAHPKTPRAHADQFVDEKADCRPGPSAHPTALLPPGAPTTPTQSLPTHAAPSWPAPAPYHLPRGHRIAGLLRPWLPVLAYGATSLAFVLAIAFWKDELFAGLDALAQWLRQDAYTGYAVAFLLIFLTTIPPLPLYSTLIILSGYAFGPWAGLAVSYAASLAGALCVFALSRALLRAHIARWLASAPAVRRVVRAIERRPRLLFLIRLAPYPYNVMNCLLAAAPALSLRTYALCTALSLGKLVIHTSIGASLRSFAARRDAPEGDDALGRWSAAAGVALCVAIFVYLSYVTRAAVDDELSGEEGAPDEREAFLPSGAADVEAQAGPQMVAMARVPLRHADSDAFAALPLANPRTTDTSDSDSD